MSCSPCDEKCYYYGSTTCGGYGVCGDCIGIKDTQGSAMFTGEADSACYDDGTAEVQVLAIFGDR